MKVKIISISNIKEIFDSILSEKQDNDKEQNEELRESVIYLIKDIINNTKKANVSLQHYLNVTSFQSIFGLKEDDKCICLNCLLKSFASLTVDDIKSLDANNVLIIENYIANFIDSYHKEVHDGFTNLINSTLKVKNGTLKEDKYKDNYDNMTKEALIELLRSNK